jgi:hypothetical protein
VGRLWIHVSDGDPHDGGFCEDVPQLFGGPAEMACGGEGRRITKRITSERSPSHLGYPEAMMILRCCYARNRGSH